MFSLFKDKELQKLKDAEESLRIVSDKARQCLGYDDFKSYRDSYVRAESGMLDAIINYTNNFVQSEHGDVNKYAITMIRYITKLQDLRSLLNTIETDAKRGRSVGRDNQK